MKTNKLLTIFLLTLAMLLAGNFTYAATDDETQDALDKTADQYNKNISNARYQVVCTREAPVGSRIKRKVCRTVATIENSQRKIKERMQKLRTSIGPQP